MAQERQALQQKDSDSGEEVSYPGSDYAPVRSVVRVFLKIADYISRPASGRLEHDREFRTGRAQEYPNTPGEEFQNRELSRIRSLYGGSQRDSDSIRSGISRHSRHRSDTVSSGDGKGFATHHEIAAEPTQPICTRRRQDTSDTLEVPSPVLRSTTQRSIASSSTPPPIIRIETLE